MRRTFMVVIAAMLLVGSGCPSSGRAVIATPDMMPERFSLMPGLVPADRQSWRVIGTQTRPRIDTFWRTDALFDKVEAYYIDFIGKEWGLVTHTVEDKAGVKIFWSLAGDANAADKTKTEYIAITKAQKDGKTSVEIVISPRIP